MMDVRIAQHCLQLKAGLWHTMSILLTKWIDLTEAICPDYEQYRWHIIWRARHDSISHWLLEVGLIVRGVWQMIMIRPSIEAVTLAAKSFLMGHLIVEVRRASETHLLHLSQLSPCVLIIPQILLIAHEDYGNIWAEVLHLRRPLFWNVLWEITHTFKIDFIQMKKKRNTLEMLYNEYNK